MSEATIPRVLTIAGSDSGGGAGIEADLKTFTALDVYGMAAITSVTAQNTVGVTGVHDVPAAFVAKQIDAVVTDIGVDAAKTGMLSNAEIIEAVAGQVLAHRIERLVVDPVMISTSGASLLQPSGQAALRAHILPLALLVTPNIPEAEALTEMRIDCEEALREAARRILGMGPRYVLIKGGHLSGPEATDSLFDGSAFHTFSMPRIDTPNVHGTGCTYSAAIAAFLARGLPMTEAVERAKAYVTGAIRHSLALGQGHGPLNHFWQGHGE